MSQISLSSDSSPTLTGLVSLDELLHFSALSFLICAMGVRCLPHRMFTEPADELSAHWFLQFVFSFLLQDKC